LYKQSVKQEHNIVGFGSYFWSFFFNLKS